MEKPKAALVDEEGERHFIFDDQAIIGRGSSANSPGETYVISLRDSSISRKHCVIKRNPDNTYAICDMSTRGTYLNKIPLVKKKPTPLNHKDIISLLPSGVFSYTFWINKAWQIPTSEAHIDLTYYLTEQILPLEKSYYEEVQKIDEQLGLMGTTSTQEQELRKKKDSLNSLLSDIRIEKTELENKLIALEEQNHIREAELESKITNLKEVNKDLECKLQEREMALLQKEEDLRQKELVLEKKTAAEESFKKEMEGLEEQLQCSICVEMYIEPMILNCGHMFCKSCLNQWKKKQKICPVCRTKISQCVRTFHLEGIIEKNVALLTAEAKRNREEIIEERTTPSKKGKNNKRKSTGELVAQNLATTVVTQPASTSSNTATVTTTSEPVPTVILALPVPSALNQPTGANEPTSVQLDPFAFAEHAIRRRLRERARPETPVPVAAIDLTSLPHPSTPPHLLPGPSYIDLTTP